MLKTIGKWIGGLFVAALGLYVTAVFSTTLRAVLPGTDTLLCPLEKYYRPKGSPTHFNVLVSSFVNDKDNAIQTAILQHFALNSAVNVATTCYHPGTVVDGTERFRDQTVPEVVEFLAAQRAEVLIWGVSQGPKEVTVYVGSTIDKRIPRPKRFDLSTPTKRTLLVNATVNGILAVNASKVQDVLDHLGRNSLDELSTLADQIEGTIVSAADLDSHPEQQVELLYSAGVLRSLIGERTGQLGHLSSANDRFDQALSLLDSEAQLERGDLRAWILYAQARALGRLGEQKGEQQPLVLAKRKFNRASEQFLRAGQRQLHWRCAINSALVGSQIARMFGDATALREAEAMLRDLERIAPIEVLGQARVSILSYNRALVVAALLARDATDLDVSREISMIDKLVSVFEREGMHHLKVLTLALQARIIATVADRSDLSFSEKIAQLEVADQKALEALEFFPTGLKLSRKTKDGVLYRGIVLYNLGYVRLVYAKAIGESWLEQQGNAAVAEAREVLQSVQAVKLIETIERDMSNLTHAIPRPMDAAPASE